MTTFNTAGAVSTLGFSTVTRRASQQVSSQVLRMRLIWSRPAPAGRPDRAVQQFADAGQGRIKIGERPAVTGSTTSSTSRFVFNEVSDGEDKKPFMSVMDGKAVGGMGPGVWMT